MEEARTFILPLFALMRVAKKKLSRVQARAL